MPSIDIERATHATDDVRSLVGDLEAELAQHYPPENRHGLRLDALFAPHVRFFIARVDGAALGCCGIALFDGYAEVKRMFVRPAARGTGVAAALLAHVESVAAGAGYALVHLETGTAQHAAIRLYERSGYRRCAAFGAYRTMSPAAITRSIFMEKPLPRPPRPSTSSG